MQDVQLSIKSINSKLTGEKLLDFDPDILLQSIFCGVLISFRLEFVNIVVLGAFSIKES